MIVRSSYRTQCHTTPTVITNQRSGGTRTRPRLFATAPLARSVTDSESTGARRAVGGWVGESGTAAEEEEEPGSGFRGGEAGSPVGRTRGAVVAEAHLEGSGSRAMDGGCFANEDCTNWFWGQDSWGNADKVEIDKFEITDLGSVALSGEEDTDCEPSQCAEDMFDQWSNSAPMGEPKQAMPLASAPRRSSMTSSWPGEWLEEPWDEFSNQTTIVRPQVAISSAEPPVPSTIHDPNSTQPARNPVKPNSKSKSTNSRKRQLPRENTSLRSPTAKSRRRAPNDRQQVRLVRSPVAVR